MRILIIVLLIRVLKNGTKLYIGILMVSTPVLKLKISVDLSFSKCKDIVNIFRIKTSSCKIRYLEPYFTLFVFLFFKKSTL